MSDKPLARAFADLFDEADLTTPEEVDERYYDITGHDPDEVAAKMKAAAEQPPKPLVYWDEMCRFGPEEWERMSKLLLSGVEGSLAREFLSGGREQLSTSASSGAGASSLSFENTVSVVEAVENMQPDPLYYVISDAVPLADEKGKPVVLLVGEDERGWWPQYFICHPALLWYLKEELAPGLRLVPLSEWKPDFLGRGPLTASPMIKKPKGET